MKLVDLHCPWFWQYAGETTILDASRKMPRPQQARMEGYLQAVLQAVLVCARPDWETRPDPFAELANLITRYESEFSGRLLIGPDDLARRASAPRDRLCYGVIAVGGLGAIIRETGDLPALARLFDRGARVFLLADPWPGRAGPDPLFDHGGLTTLGRDTLSALASLPDGEGGGRPILDLARLSLTSITQVLDWYRSSAERASRLPMMLGTLALDDPLLGESESLAGLRALGCVIGLEPGPDQGQGTNPLKHAIDTLAELPYLGVTGARGIAVGANLLGAKSVPAELAHPSAILDWLKTNFDPQTALELAQGAALRVLDRGCTIGI